MKCMRVTYILSSPISTGGATKSFLNLLDGILCKDVSALVVLPEYGALCSLLESRGVKWRIIPFRFEAYPPCRSLTDFSLFIPRLVGRIGLNILARIRLTNLLEDFRPDIIHTNVGPVKVGFSVAKKLKIPHIWHLREYQDLDFDIHPMPTMKSFKASLRNPNNYTIAITEALSEYFSLDPLKSEVIYNGVLSENDSRFCSSKEPYFLFAGRIEKAKGIDTLIDVFVNFCQLNTSHKLLVVGNAPDKKFLSRLTAYVSSKQLDDRIVFLGERSDLFDLMFKSTAVIIPSLNEGFGRVTVEAMIHGCLVIGRNTGGTKEILNQGKSIGLPYDTSEELLHYLITVPDNIESYFPMIKKAQLIAVDKYSTEQNIDKTWSLYCKILNNNRHDNIFV